MWTIENRTPYAADRVWRQDKEGNKLWMVVVKATFRITPQSSTVEFADEQVPVTTLAEPWGTFGETSLAYECDLFGVKSTTDVLLNGSAWAPKGQQVRSLTIEMRVGPMRKRLCVFGDRIWERSLGGSVSPTEPKWFDCMPIRYERAYGGRDLSSSDPAQHRVDDRNPVGTGFVTSSERCIKRSLPNIEYPDQLVWFWRNRPPPAGLNAVDCSWSPRRQLAGTYDDVWRQNRFPLWAEDFDPRYNNCAPRDQQTDVFLRGGEFVELLNLSPTGRLAFTLPRIHLCFQTRFGRERQEHRGQLCTVLFEPDVARVVMVWQTAMVCNHRADDLDETVVTEKIVRSKI